MIQVGVPIQYDGKRYFVNDFGGVLNLLWKELHARAGGRKISKPKGRIVYTANLRGYVHFYDTYYVLEAELLEGDEDVQDH